jgi:hypothetical protein
MPAYDPAASLYYENGRWTIHYDFPAGVEPRPLPLSAEAINRVLDSIAEHAVPSV